MCVQVLRHIDTDEYLRSVWWDWNLFRFSTNVWVDMYIYVHIYVCNSSNSLHLLFLILFIYSTIALLFTISFSSYLLLSTIFFCYSIQRLTWGRSWAQTCVQISLRVKCLCCLVFQPLKLFTFLFPLLSINLYFLYLIIFFMSMYIYVCICVCMYIYMYMYVYVYVYIYMYMYIYIFFLLSLI